jgi:hypothetical protein
MQQYYETLVTLRDITEERGSIKEGNKEVEYLNMVNLFSIQE